MQILSDCLISTQTAPYMLPMRRKMSLSNAGLPEAEERAQRALPFFGYQIFFRIPDLSDAKDGKITIEHHDLRRLLYGLDIECILKKRSFICM